MVLAILVGAVQGGTQALSRSLFASLIPRDKSGEFFGFLRRGREIRRDIRARACSPSRSSRNAILAIIAFFVVGGCLLFFVDVAEGQRSGARR